MSRNILLAVCAAGALASCSGDGFSFGAGSVRGYVIDFNTGQLVEYSAPPIAERRRMPLLGADGRSISPALTNPVLGGFYAVRIESAFVFRAGPGLPSTAWSLVRFGSGFGVEAVQQGLQIVGPDTFALQGWAMTADGRFLVGQRSVGTRGLVVLDAVSLHIIDTIAVAANTGIYPQGYLPPGTMGPQVLLRRFTAGNPCGLTYLWLDVTTRTVVDSAAMICGHSYAGAQAPHRLYLRPDSVDGQLVIWDAQLQQRVARQDSLGFSTQLIADTARGEIIEILGGEVAFVDAATLAVRRVLKLGDPPAPPTVVDGVLDPHSGALFAFMAVPIPAERGNFFTEQRLAVIDVARAKLAAELAIPPGQAPAILR